MFGYVKPCKPELKIKDYELYRGVYCSLCKTLGQEYSVVARLLLNYDLTFFVLVLLSISDDTDTCFSFQSGRCSFNPTKKCNFAKEPHESYKQGAALTVILSYYKAKDAVEDDKGFKKLLARLLLLCLRHDFKRACKRYPQYAEIAENSVTRQREVQKDKTAGTDAAAHPSATALSEILALQGKSTKENESLGRFGYCIGRFVYLADAYDDMNADLKSGNFNPFFAKYNITNEQDISRADTRAAIEASLRLTVSEAVAAYEKLSIHRFSAVLENILYDGLEQRVLQLSEKEVNG